MGKPKQEQPRLSYKFKAYGHPNILAKHVKTLEFTKDEGLTERGDCIVGIKADFEKNELKKFNKKAKIIIRAKDHESGNIHESIHKFTINKNFNSNDELVIRKSSFDSDRTFGFNLNRGSNHIPRDMVEIMKDEDCEIEVEILEGWY